MSAFDDLSSMAPLALFDGIAARELHGERLTMAVVELDPDSVVPEHSHEQEQLGIVLRGTVTFHVGDERRELRPGATWRITSGTSHEVEVGPEGAVVIDVFAPIRDDWEALERLPEAPPRWP